MAAPRISFIGVVRYADQVCVSSFSPKGSEEQDVQAVKALLSDPGKQMQPFKRYSSEGALFTVHMLPDESSRIFACVTDREYPARIAFTLLDEIRTKFITKVGEKSLTAKEGSLNRTMKDTYTDACMKYEDIKNVDKLASVQGKVDVVKTIMEENIQQLLANQEQLERISQNAENLNEQAKVFQSRSSALRRQMMCKKIKMWILLGFVITTILIIIITPLVIMAKNRVGGNSSG